MPKCSPRLCCDCTSGVPVMCQDIGDMCGRDCELMLSGPNAQSAHGVPAVDKEVKGQLAEEDAAMVAEEEEKACQGQISKRKQ